MANDMNVESLRDIMGRDIEDAPYPNSLIPKLGNDELAAVGPGTDSHVERIGFWRRQFQSEITRGQTKFDWIFGVILPVICFYFDPIVFRNGAGEIGPALLGKISAFAHVLSLAAVLGTMAWLLWGEKLGWLNAPLAGLFVISSVAALAIGIFISPYSLLGLIVLIGALGFTPFFTSFVLLRNSIRTFGAAKLSLPKNLLVNSFALAAVASAVIPYLINLFYSRH